LKPDLTPAHNNLGLALRDSGNLEAAIASFKEALRLNRKYAPAHFNLGLVLEKQGDLDVALAAYEMAAMLGPEHQHFKRAYDELSARMSEEKGRTS
jgi:tetratricopeptide (TPR) repeat protein